MYNNIFGAYGTLPLCYTERILFANRDFYNFCQTFVPSRNFSTYINNIQIILFYLTYNKNKSENNVYKMLPVNKSYNTISVAQVGLFLVGKSVAFDEYDKNMQIMTINQYLL